MKQISVPAFVLSTIVFAGCANSNENTASTNPTATARANHASKAPADKKTTEAPTSKIATWINSMKDCIIDHGAQAESFKNPTSLSIGVHAPASVGANADAREAYTDAYAICARKVGDTPRMTREEYENFEADVETY